MGGDACRQIQVGCDKLASKTAALPTDAAASTGTPERRPHVKTRASRIVVCGQLSVPAVLKGVLRRACHTLR